MKYDIDVLGRYGRVVSAPFGYMRRLANLRVDVGLLPWRVGISVAEGDVSVNLHRADLSREVNPTHNTVSVVTSQKAFTKEQVHRLKLIEYLDQRLPELRLHGNGISPVLDKAVPLSSSRFHLALENCVQRDFWTEKLSDPILMQNVTFYSGHNGWHHRFPSPEGIIEVDVRRPAKTYEIIRRTLDSEPYEALRPDLRSNKDAVLNGFGPHWAITRAILSMKGSRRPTAGRLTIPEHRSRFRRLLPTQLGGNLPRN